MDTKTTDTKRVFARQVATFIEDQELETVAGGLHGGCFRENNGDTCCIYGPIKDID